MTIQEALTYLSVGGSAIVAAALSSSFYETQSWFQSQTPAGRKFITVITAVVLGLGAVAVVQLVPAETMEAAQPYFTAFIAAVAPFLGSEIYHRLTKKSEPSTVIQGGLQQDVRVSAGPAGTINVTTPDEASHDA